MKYFGEFESSMILIIHETQGENILTPDNMDILYEIWMQSLNVSMYYNKEHWDFDDLCTKAYDSKNEPCNALYNSLFGIFQLNPTLWSTQESIQTFIDNYQYLMQVM